MSKPEQNQSISRSQPILVTGGAGFIGSNFVLDWLRYEGSPVVNLDALTYAGNMANLADLEEDRRHIFVKGEIGDRGLITRLLEDHKPRAIVHFAAETHVDRSLLDPAIFVHTNINGTASLLEAARAFVQAQSADHRAGFRFLHVSTDEVYGTLTPDAPAFRETSPYAPNSPYAASKAASDMLVRAWHQTYGLPTLITNCSNNYGPFQFPEKLIPLVITQALAGRELPVYGDGQQVRDWLFVCDHTAAIRQLLEVGTPGETYNIGGNNQKTILEVVRAICALLDELAPDSRFKPHDRLIRFVTDRPGHDHRYAIDATKIKTQLSWRPKQSFESGLRGTVQWYLSNEPWVNGVRTGAHRNWMAQNYDGRSRPAEPAAMATAEVSEICR